MDAERDALSALHCAHARVAASNLSRCRLLLGAHSRATVYLEVHKAVLLAARRHRHRPLLQRGSRHMHHL
eukprot:1755444-Amphidinium_carterae.1